MDADRKSLIRDGSCRQILDLLNLLTLPPSISSASSNSNLSQISTGVIKLSRRIFQIKYLGQVSKMNGAVAGKEYVGYVWCGGQRCIKFPNLRT